MIATIDSQCDLSLYLENQEIVALHDTKLEGKLLGVRSKRVGAITLALDEELPLKKGSMGIYIFDDHYFKEYLFSLDVFMTREFFSYFQDSPTGHVGTRQRMRDGSKIDFYTIERLEGMERMQLEFIREYLEE